MKHYVVPIYELNGKIKAYSMKVSCEEINILEAAPDLLEALKSILGQIKAEGNICIAMETKIHFAQQAILKAERRE